MFTLDSEVENLFDEIKGFNNSEILDDRGTNPSDIPFKLVVVTTSLTARYVDIFEAAVNCAKAAHFVPAIILSRSCLETTAVFFNVFKQTEKYVEDGKNDQFLEFLDRCALGTRDESTEFSALNVLSAIQKLDKTFSGTEKIYANLSEYAHPNWIGTFGSYVSSKKNANGFDVVKLDLVPSKDLKPSLSISVGILAYYRRQISKLTHEDSRLAQNRT